MEVEVLEVSVERRHLVEIHPTDLLEVPKPKFSLAQAGKTEILGVNPRNPGRKNQNSQNRLKICPLGDLGVLNPNLRSKTCKSGTQTEILGVNPRNPGAPGALLTPLWIWEVSSQFGAGFLT